MQSILRSLISKERLNTAGAVQLSHAQIEEIVDVLSTYAARDRDRVPDFMLEDSIKLLSRDADQRARQAVVGALKQIWRSAGGQGVGAYYNRHKKQHSGTLIRFLQECLQSVHETPSEITLYRDVISQRSRTNL